MDSFDNGKRPSFFWQGLMILLPVAVLAVVGLVSLRADEHAAEEDARKKAAENVQILARAIGPMVTADVAEYCDLQDRWVMALGAISQPNIPLFSPDDKLTARIETWERAHPGIKVADVAVPQSQIRLDRHAVMPPEIPIAPLPPKWYSELSPEKREQWQALRDVASFTNAANRDSLSKAFLAGSASEASREAALDLFEAPEQLLRSPELSSESGISFQDIACYHLLRGGEPLTQAEEQGLWECLFHRPSFAAPSLLDAAERFAGDTAAFKTKVQWMRALWDAQSRARELLEPICRLVEFPRSESWYPSNTPPVSTCWSKGASAVALASIVGLTNCWDIVFVPRPVLESVFDRALKENRFLVPDYVSPIINVEGEMMPVPPVARPDEKSRLATASQKFGIYSPAGSFAVSFYLTDHAKMLAAEQRRSRLVAALIAAALLAAVAGFITARRAFYQQHRLSEMKSNFVSSVSHELRAPIASMRLMAEGLERGKISDPAKQKEYFHFLTQESRRLTSLIENVLDFSRIEQGRKEYRFEATNLAGLAEQTVKSMQPSAAERQVELAWKPGVAAPQTMCDGLAIQQALVNLIDNAIKHSPPGKRVTVGLERAGDAIELYVEDSGAGIPAEEHGKIFERFYRRGSELRRETQGIGIGLTIVKHIVEAHGGRVKLRSAPGEGSRFAIELPIK